MVKYLRRIPLHWICLATEEFFSIIVDGRIKGHNRSQFLASLFDEFVVNYRACVFTIIESLQWLAVLDFFLELRRISVHCESIYLPSHKPPGRQTLLCRIIHAFALFVCLGHKPCISLGQLRHDNGAWNNSWKIWNSAMTLVDKPSIPSVKNWAVC